MNYAHSKYVTDAQNLRKTIEKYGVAIIEKVIDKKEIEEMNKGVWTSLEKITERFETPIKKEDKETWKSFYDLYPNHGMLLQHFGIGHAQYIWDLRQNPKIIDIFATLWDTHRYNIVSSFDAMSFHIPPELTGLKRYFKDDWMHCDQSFNRNDLQCVQSWVTGFDIEEGDATLAVMEKSNLLHGKFSKAFDVTDKADWYKLTSEHLQWYIENGCNRISIKCNAGDMVFWDSRTIHCGQQPIKGRATPKFRHVVYMCMTPKHLISETNMKKRKEAFEKLRMTSHWPNIPKLFPKTPRTYGQPIKKTCLLDDPVLTDLGKSIVGYEVEWKDYDDFFFVDTQANTDKNITREEAECSATEWLGPSPSVMRNWLVGAIMDKEQHRDIGKVLANVAEIHVSKWLTEKSGRNVKCVTGKSWDAITDDDKPKVHAQFKFRMSDWHFETTRRNSKKNENTNSTGHVAYSKDEFDMVAIFKPSSSFGITGSTIRCIPVSALINPSKPEQLVTRINASIRKIYDNDAKTDEVIKMIYQTLPLPLD